MSHVLAQDLRLAVFQTAFSGGLTERCNEDSSVDEYLNDCRDKRLEYEKKYKEKKHKSLWETGDYETPFDIPDEWRWAYVGDIFRHNAGKALNAKNTAGTKRKYLTTSNVYTDHVELDNLREMYYTDDEVEKCSVQKGDLLVLEGGDCGRTALWDLDESYCIQNHLHRLRLFGEGNIKYFFYLLSFYKDAGYTKGKGIAIQGLSANALHNIVIPIPPIEEQGRIVAKIDELMAKIDEYEKIETQLTELKKAFPGNMKDAILQAAMQGKLTESFDYTECEYGDLFEISGGSQPSKSQFITKPQEGYIQLYQTRDYGPNPQPVYIPLKTASKQTKEGDILLARYGGSLGKVFLAKDGAYNVAMAKVIYKHPKLHNPKFVYYYHLSPTYQNFCLSVVNGRSAQAGFNKDDIGVLPYNLFSIEEQRRIVDKLDQLLPLCEQLAKMVA